MSAILLPPGVYHGIDTVHSLTPEQLAAIAPHVSWVARYTRPDGKVLDEPKPGGDWSGCHSISHLEREHIRDAGLLFLPLQFGSWTTGVTAPRGHGLGVSLRACARKLSVAPGVHLWPDYEGSWVQAVGAQAGREALEALSAVVCGDGIYRAGLYYSLPQPLSGAQLYALKGYTSYWAAAQPSLALPLPRGAAIRQRLMRAGWRSSTHQRWCDELRIDCPVEAATFGEVPGCPVRPGLQCLIPLGCPGYDPNVLRADLLGDLPVLDG